jgi:hypothetical protein
MKARWTKTGERCTYRQACEGASAKECHAVTVHRGNEERVREIDSDY